MGKRLLVKGNVCNWQYSFRNIFFNTDAYMILLVGCGMVLWIQWLVSLGSIIWNFKVLIMEFTIANQTFILQSLIASYLREESDLVGSKGESTKDLFLHLLDDVEESVREPLGLEVEGLLETFEDVFVEPKGLSPNRSHDHSITLKSDAQPVHVRPHRYPYFQKEEIEKIVAELLVSGVIKPSQSHISSSVLLGRKADGSWRMCMDYRALNKETVKDKFLILVIDELLDKLHDQ